MAPTQFTHLQHRWTTALVQMLIKVKAACWHKSINQAVAVTFVKIMRQQSCLVVSAALYSNSSKLSHISGCQGVNCLFLSRKFCVYGVQYWIVAEIPSRALLIPVDIVLVFRPNSLQPISCCCDMYDPVTLGSKCSWLSLHLFKVVMFIIKNC